MQRLTVLFGIFAFSCAQYNGDFQFIPCSKADPNISQCFRDQMEAAREIIADKVDPLVVEETNVDQAVNDLLWIKAQVKNARTTGFKNAVIEKFRVYPKTMTTEFQITIPFVHLEMEYDVNGQLLIIPMQSKGYFKGNFTDVKMFFRGLFKQETTETGEHLKLDKLEFLSRVDNGVIKMISKNPALQFAADMIANFYNDNPRRVMDAINPIYTRSSAIFFKNWANEILAKVPAGDILVE